MNKEDAIKKLRENNEAVLKGEGVPFSVEQLTEITQAFSVKLADNVEYVLLYSGPLEPDGKGGFVRDKSALWAWVAANNIAINSSNIGVVDDTEAMKFVYSKDFDTALDNTANHYGLNKEWIISGSLNPDGTRNADGINDDVSRRFIIENADKPTILLAPFANLDSVFMLSEVSQAMVMDGGDIEGLPRKILQEIYHEDADGLEDVNMVLSVLSLNNIFTMRFGLNEYKDVTGVDIRKSWNGAVKSKGDFVLKEGEETKIVSMEELLEKLDDDQLFSLCKRIEDVEKMLKHPVDLSPLKEFCKNGGWIADVENDLDDKNYLGF